MIHQREEANVSLLMKPQINWLFHIRCPGPWSIRVNKEGKLIKKSHFCKAIPVDFLFSLEMKLISRHEFDKRVWHTLLPAPRNFLIQEYLITLIKLSHLISALRPSLSSLDFQLFTLLVNCSSLKRAPLFWCPKQQE
jgi:hypothetical protein